MCGIAAMLGFTETRADKAVVERMAASMRHRGPDGNGIRVAGPVGLGFRIAARTRDPRSSVQIYLRYRGFTPCLP